MAINEEFKAEFPTVDFRTFENFEIEYKKRFFKRLVSQKRKPKRRLGHNGIKYLLHLMQRSRLLYSGLIDSINQENPTLAFLAARAHLEITAALAYFLFYLKKYYDREIQYDDLDKKVFALILGDKRRRDRDPSFPSAINVMNMIDYADKLIKRDETFSELNEPFAFLYENISEKCHPNWEGISIGSRTNGTIGTVDFLWDCRFDERDVNSAIGTTAVSCILFFEFYDNCFDLLKNNEEPPTLIR